ncbi:MAG TPA: ABC transporter substrate-binding protein [Alphaproteobacteria bacterium]|nr:ABC transporter substrate-binding protein [Alphaproteobacteria bacterium]
MTRDGAHTGWRFAIVGAVLLASLAGWAQPPTSKGTLRIAVAADVPGLDPHRVPGTAALHVLGNLFNGLLTLDAMGNAAPDLAESWEIREHGQVYVFHLRRGVTFHDGTPFDAAAVRWNYRRLRPADEPTLHAPIDHLIEAVDALDAYTVRFTLTRPRRDLVPVLAAFFATVVQRSPAAYQLWGPQEVRWHPVGTGPYRLTRWESGHRLIFERNPHYFKPGLPYLDRLDWRIIPAGVTRVTALRAGEVEFAHAVPRAHVARLASDPQLQVFRGRETRAIHTLFNLRRPAFQDVRVRRALLGYGLDRQAIAKMAFLGLAQPLWSIVPPGATGYLELGDLFPYAPEEAKALLRDAGYGSIRPLRYTLTFPGANPLLATVAAIMQAQFRDNLARRTLTLPGAGDDHPLNGATRDSPNTDLYIENFGIKASRR